MRTIFVFGSNREGRHGKGSALFAKKFHGAIQGHQEGLQGDSYAIVTKELRPWKDPVSLQEIHQGVERFIQFALAHPDLEFKVSALGCGLAGYKPADIAPMFKYHPANVGLPFEFQLELGEANEYVSPDTIKS
jgi:hypothetical protein